MGHIFAILCRDLCKSFDIDTRMLIIMLNQLHFLKERFANIIKILFNSYFHNGILSFVLCSNGSIISEMYDHINLCESNEISKHVLSWIGFSFKKNTICSCLLIHSESWCPTMCTILTTFINNDEILWKPL